MAIRARLAETPDPAVRTRAAKTERANQEDHKIGEYDVDYGSVPTDEIGKPVPEMDELLKRSRVISAKRGL